jgi:hypothetical protein
MARRSVIGNEACGTSIHTTPTTRRYTHTSMATTGKVSSLEQRRFGNGALHRSGQMAPNSGGSSRAWFLSCTGTPLALEGRRRSLPVMRTNKESSHRWWAEVTRMIRDSQWRSGPMIMKPGAKQPHNHGD